MMLAEFVAGRRALLKLDVPRIEAFEAGEGGLGVAELMRIANALGVPGTCASRECRSDEATEITKVPRSVGLAPPTRL
jgi:hypothetical protein